jgi:ribosomal protein L15E
MGFKAKQGYVVYRVRVRRGGRKKPLSKVSFCHQWCLFSGQWIFQRRRAAKKIIEA